MKSLRFIILGIVIASIVFFVLMFREIKQTGVLEIQRQEKQKIILEAATAKKKLAKLNKELDELREASQFSKVMILSDDAGVLSAIKELSRLAAKNGLKNVEFTYVTDYGILSGTNINADLAKAYGLKNAHAVFISAKFEAEYLALSAFLKEIYSLKTTLSVEHLDIARDTEILPRQNVMLVLAAYMY